MTLNLTKALLWSPVVQIMILITGTVISFTTAYIRNDVSLYLPFISETGAFVPAMNIFSLCLILGSFVGCLYVFFRYTIFKINYLQNDRLFQMVNFITFIIGIISMIGMAGVAAFPMTTVFWAHILFAAMYFVGSAVYFLGSTIITFKMYGPATIFIVRSVLTAVIFILLFFLVLCFPIALKNWHAHNEVIPALKKPGDEGFTLILISSALEWCIVTTILCFTVSFRKEFNLNCIKINTEQCKEDSSEVAVQENVEDI